MVPIRHDRGGMLCTVSIVHADISRQSRAALHVPNAAHHDVARRTGMSCVARSVCVSCVGTELGWVEASLRPRGLLAGNIS